jgi:gliding motility-associated-like protein
MKKKIHIIFYIFLFALSHQANAQLSTTAPYCCGPYTTGQCNQPGPSNAPGNFINDFIDNFSTTGGNTNISNLSSGCNAQANNCANHCSHYMAVSPGQTIVCTMSSGNTFAQGFAIFVDWDQDNVFNITNEFVGSSAGVPAATTPTTITFIIPLTQSNGIYRMRVRCAFATNGPNITPCGTFGFGETEDYTLFVGPVPPNAAVPTGTALVNTPICVGQALSFSFATTYSTPLSYTWTGPGTYSSAIANPTIANASATATGIYTVLVTNSICPITRTVSAVVVSYPVYTISPATYTICQGGSFIANINSFMSPSLYTANWASSAPGLIFNPTPTAGNPPVFSTNVVPALLPINVSTATYIYSVTISPTLHTCPLQQTMTLTINNPLTPTINPAPPLCDIFSPVQLTAAPGGGTWSANNAVSPSGLFTPGVATSSVNSVLYTVSSGTCLVSNTTNVFVSKFRTAALTSSVNTRCVQDPVFDLMNIVQNTVTGVWSGPQVNNNQFIAAGLPSGNYSFTYNTISQPNPSVCPASTVLVISVFNPPTPLISPIPPLCNNAATVALTAAPPNGVWSGNPGVSSTGIRTPSLNIVGTNSVIYTAGQGTCVASSSATFHLSRYNTALLNGIAPQLCVNSSPFNLMSIVQNTTGIWSGPIGVTNNTTFNPSLVSVTSTYSAVYSTTSSPIAGLCDESSTLAISVLVPAAPNINQVGPYCNADAAVQLSVNPATGVWIPSPYLSASGVFTPSLGALGNNAVQYVIGTNTCNLQQTKIIKVEAFVSSQIAGNISDLCTSSPALNLSPFSINNSGTWSGPGILGSNFYPGNTGAGNFIISYNTSSIPNGLCPSQSTVAVKVFSLAPPFITQVGPFCNNALPVQMQVSPTGGLFGGASVGAITSSGLFNPALGLIGDNFISYSVSVGPCIANAQAKITIEKFISADFGETPQTAYCKNNLPFNLNSLVQNPGGTWSTLGSGLVGTTMFDPSIALIGVTTLTYQTNSFPTAQCSDSKTITIKVKELPSIVALSSNPKGCAPLEVVFNTPSVNSGKSLWTISDGYSQSGTYISHIFSIPGTYSVVFNYADEEALGCSTQVVLSTPITIYSTPKPNFSVSSEEIFISDPVASIVNLSSDIYENKYEWMISPNATFSYSSDINPKITFPQIGNYRITLLATSKDACYAEMSKLVTVKNDFNVYIPNSFTPNYDGLNDVFIPVFTLYGLDTKTFEMEIFDRWGHEIYSTRDYAKGWDGTRDGQTLKQGTYIYKIKYKDLEGKLYYQTGFLSLLPN